MKSWKWLLSYVTMASLGLGFALVISLKFVKAARSQTPGASPSAQAPSSGDLPPEFLNETGSPAPATPTRATPPTTAATPAPATSATPSPAPTSNASPTPAASPSASASPNATPTSATTGTTTGATAPATNPPPAQNSAAAPAGTPANAAATAASAAQQKAAQPTDQPENITAPAPVVRLGGEDYVYDPTGRRDPFKPYRTLQMLQAKPPPSTVTTSSSNEPQIPLEPLQRWDLERLKIIGILWEVRAPKAMVRDPDGAVFTVMKNTKMGRYNGYVAAIREGEVVVVETLDYDGQTRKETKILELGK